MIETGDQASRLQGRNVWARGCLGLVITSWCLLGYLALADAVLSGDTASDNAFDLVYGLLGLVTVAAPILGIAALVAIRKRGRLWLAWIAFALALVLPCIFAIALVSFGGDGIFGSPD